MKAAENKPFMKMKNLHKNTPASGKTARKTDKVHFHFMTKTAKSHRPKRASGKTICKTVKANIHGRTAEYTRASLKTAI